MRNAIGVIGSILLMAVASFATVNVTSPSAGSTVGSSVHVTGNASMSGTVTALQVYIDGAMKYQANGASVDTYISLGGGSHYIVLQSWNNYGQYAKSAGFSFNVSGTTSTGINVTSPAQGSTVGSPVPVSASASMSGTVTTMQVYVDGNLLYQGNGSTVNTSLSNVGGGSHQLVVQSWNSYGQYAKSGTISFNVGSTTSTSSGTSTSSSTSIPSYANVYSNIDQMSGWSSCDSCAGAGGSGPTVSYSMSGYQSSPSMDGASAVYWLGGGTPYSDALWWKQLGANSSASHFVYDTYFYYTDASAPQALEFDLNQSVGGYKYIFGTQCNMRGDGQWDVWDNINARWSGTGIACPAPPTYTWNHLVWEFERVSGQLHFIAVTLNGVKHYVNRYYAPRASSANELNVAFQMDGNYAQTSYKVWLDKVMLSAW